MDRRRVVVVSEDLAEPWDDGRKNFARLLANALEQKTDVRVLSVDRGALAGPEAVHIPSSRTFLRRELWQEIRYHEPDIVLYIPASSSTLASFARSAVLRRAAPGAAVGMIALGRRTHGRLAKLLLKYMAPDVVWVPSYRSLLHLSRLSIRGDVLPVGVDTAAFTPPGTNDKKDLRRQHGIADNAFVCLHIGRLSPQRNVQALGILKAIPNTEVIAIGRAGAPEGDAASGELEARGVRVIRERVDVSEFYKIADCYVFPAKNPGGAIEIPPSVPEALASGCPVLTTPFGGLRDFFVGGDDLRYWETEDELLAAAKDVRETPPQRVRDMSEFSWACVADRVLDTLTRR